MKQRVCLTDFRPFGVSLSCVQNLMEFGYRWIFRKCETLSWNYPVCMYAYTVCICMYVCTHVCLFVCLFEAIGISGTSYLTDIDETDRFGINVFQTDKTKQIVTLNYRSGNWGPKMSNISLRLLSKSLACMLLCKSISAIWDWLYYCTFEFPVLKPTVLLNFAYWKLLYFWISSVSSEISIEMISDIHKLRTTAREAEIYWCV